MQPAGPTCYRDCPFGDCGPRSPMAELCFRKGFPILGGHSGPSVRQTFWPHLWDCAVQLPLAVSGTACVKEPFFVGIYVSRLSNISFFLR